MAGLVQPGTNRLAVSIAAGDEEGSCVVYARGTFGALRPFGTASRLSPAVVQATIELTDDSTAAKDVVGERLEAGTMLHLRQWATNHAGLASSVMATHAIMLDDTPPQRPQLRPCEAEQRVYDGVYYQRATEGIVICWHAPGFADGESGIHRLEWQLARRLGTANVMDTLISTQSIENAMLPFVGLQTGLNGAGRLVLSSARINAAIGVPLALHGIHFRVGLRAVNHGESKVHCG